MNDRQILECLIAHAKSTTDNDYLYSETSMVHLDEVEDWARDVHTRLASLEEMNVILQHHLDSKIDQCVRLEIQLKEKCL